jgi:hypothetical protein
MSDEASVTGELCPDRAVRVYRMIIVPRRRGLSGLFAV